LQNVTALPSQIRSARNWGKAFYGPEMLMGLGLPPDHNDRLKKVLDEEHTERLSSLRWFIKGNMENLMKLKEAKGPGGDSRARTL
jgi:uncharacterized lipoprotein YddW (UPF0748 family)